MWVCTGDTLSTATNIAIACNLLDAEMSNEGRLFTIDREDVNGGGNSSSSGGGDGKTGGSAGSADKLSALIDKYNRTLDEAAHGEGKEGQAAAVQEFGLCFHGDVFKICQAEQEEQAKLREKNGSSKKGDEENDDENSLMTRFFDLAARCKSVVACRLEPKEKADIVSVMRKRTGKICLAIGDGNNGQSRRKQLSLLRSELHPELRKCLVC